MAIKNWIKSCFIGLKQIIFRKWTFVLLTLFLPSLVFIIFINLTSSRIEFVSQQVSAQSKHLTTSELRIKILTRIKLLENKIDSFRIIYLPNFDLIKLKKRVLIDDTFVSEKGQNILNILNNIRNELPGDNQATTPISVDNISPEKTFKERFNAVVQWYEQNLAIYAKEFNHDFTTDKNIKKVFVNERTLWLDSEGQAWKYLKELIDNLKNYTSSRSRFNEWAREFDWENNSLDFREAQNWFIYWKNSYENGQLLEYIQTLKSFFLSADIVQGGLGGELKGKSFASTTPWPADDKQITVAQALGKRNYRVDLLDELQRLQESYLYYWNLSSRPEETVAVQGNSFAPETPWPEAHYRMTIPQARAKIDYQKALYLEELKQYFEKNFVGEEAWRSGNSEAEDTPWPINDEAMTLVAASKKINWQRIYSAIPGLIDRERDEAFWTRFDNVDTRAVYEPTGEGTISGGGTWTLTFGENPRLVSFNPEFNVDYFFEIIVNFNREGKITKVELWRTYYYDGWWSDSFEREKIAENNRLWDPFDLTQHQALKDWILENAPSRLQSIN